MNVTRSLLDGIKTKQLQWYGHVSGMEEGRLPKEVMKWRPPGRRKRGRPKLPGRTGLEDWWGKRNWWKTTGMTEETGGRRYYNCQTGAGWCGNIVQTAKYICVCVYIYIYIYIYIYMQRWKNAECLKIRIRNLWKVKN